MEPPEDDPLTKKKSNHIQRKLEERRKDNKAKIDPRVEEQFFTGRLYGKIVSVGVVYGDKVWFDLKLVCLHDLARVDVVMGTSWRGKSWSSTRRSSSPRRPNNTVLRPCISLCVLPYHACLVAGAQYQNRNDDIFLVEVHLLYSACLYAEIKRDWKSNANQE